MGVITLKEVAYVGHVLEVRMGGKGHARELLGDKPKGSNHFVDLRVDCRLILKEAG